MTMPQDMGNNIARHISTQKGRSRFSRWEPSVSKVETGRFHGGNRSFPWWKQTRNYVLENLTRGLSPCELTRLVVSLLLLLVVGVNNAWGQTDMVKSVDVDVTAGETKLPTPTIEVLETPNGENKNIIFSISPTIAGVTYKYTLDGTDPSESNGTEASSILLGSPAIIKVIATHPDYLTSDVASSTSYVIPTNVPVLLQQKECIAFFMTQAKEENGKLRLTTTNIPDDNIIWHFETTDETGTYYIVKGNNPTAEDRMFICYGNDGKWFNLKSSPENSEKTKFVINDFIAANGLNYFIFQIKGQNLYVHRDGGNGNTNYIITTGSSGRTYNKTLWRIPALPTNKADMISLTHPLSFYTSNTSNAYYYRLNNVSDATYYITAPADPATEYVKGGTNTSDNATVWYLKEADDAAPITPYYYVVNAATGLYMYFSGTAGSNNAVQIKEYDSSNADSYKFIVVQAAINGNLDASGRYNFIPKALQNQANQESNALALHDTKTNPLKTLGSRNTNTKAQWTFVTAPLFCNKPAFDEEAGNIMMSCNTYSSVIHYTTDGTTPDASTPTIFTNETELSVNDTYLIKAIAVIRNDDQTASSDVTTLFNKPDVTLLDEDSNPVDENTYTYDKTAHEPTVSKVAITIGETEYVAPTSPTVSYVIGGYENNTNAGTATVNLEDNIDNDSIFFGNFSKDFTINPVVLTITADDITKGYGDPDPVLTYTVTGLLEGDELTSPLSRDEGEATGTYNIILASSLGNPNYTASFTTGKTFTITPKSLGSGSTPAPNITCDVTETGGTHSIVVKQCGNDLTLGTDYTKDHEDDGAKYYDVTVAGTGNYTGGFSVKLAKIQLSKLSGSSAPGGAALFVSDSGDANFVVPDNMAAYIVTGVSGNTLVTEQLDNIPTQVPVLLVSTIDANGFLVQTKDSPTAPSGTNLLVESTGTTFGTAEIYLLYNGEFVLNAAGTVPAGKIYLPKAAIVDGGAPSPARLFIMWDEPTGIENYQLSTLNSQRSTGTWYTLDGRKLNGIPTQKGIYIVRSAEGRLQGKNGKKVVIK